MHAGRTSALTGYASVIQKIMMMQCAPVDVHAIRAQNARYVYPEHSKCYNYVDCTILIVCLIVNTLQLYIFDSTDVLEP